MLALCAICACLLRGVQSSAFYVQVLEDPEQPGKCLYEGVTLLENETTTVHSACTQLTCRKGKGQSAFEVEGHGCDHASLYPDNCKVVTPDLTKDFPDCCPGLKCDGDPKGPVTIVG